MVIHCGNFVADAVPKCSFQEPSGELCPTDATKSIRLSACAMASAWQGGRMIRNGSPQLKSSLKVILINSNSTPLDTTGSWPLQRPPSLPAA